ncbi:MAG TPA: protein kinase [Albitalea sp.]|uniref:protein kinase domain-containing protein n=1 Tax=Piscinibacter sp. TaxID=1903157 RepID=UPI002ED5E2B6
MDGGVESDWEALSSIYEQAIELDPFARAELLERLAAERSTLLAPLQRMLSAGERMDALGFLDGIAVLDLGGTPRWAPGARVGPYRLLRHLGTGGMAQVWLGERVDGAFHREVAIKLLFQHPDSQGPGADASSARFARERDILATLDHPRIAALHDAGVTGQGQHWLALQHVQGEPVTDYCDREGLDLRQRIGLFRQVLDAVRYAHANLVIHRDLKPDNIFVTTQGEVRLLDFGIAKLVESEDGASIDSDLTCQAGRLLTPAYASPEQLRGLPLTTASDVYSLGVVLYELLCGESPYEPTSGSAAQLEHCILEEDPRPPSRRVAGEAVAAARGATAKALRRQLNPELDAVALRALAKRPWSRYPSVEALDADLGRWLAGQPVLARAPGHWTRAVKLAARHRFGVAAGLAVAVMLATAATSALLLGLQARQEAARASAARDFVLDLFRMADPDGSRGADLTARDMLEAGQRRAASTLGRQPALMGEVLEGIAEVQSFRGEHVQADASFRQATALYRRLGLTRPLARTQASQAENARRMGQRDRAGALLDEAEAVARRHPDDAMLQARVAEARGWLALDDGDLAGAEAAMRRALAAGEAGRGDDDRAVRALRALAQVEGERHQHRQAREHIERAAARATRIPGIDAGELLAIDLQRARIHVDEGRHSSALRGIEAALARCSGPGGTRAPPCAALRETQAQVLLRLGELEAARQLVPQLLQGSSDDGALIVACRVLAAHRELPPGHDLRRRLVLLADPPASMRLPRATEVAATLALAEAALFDDEPARAAVRVQRLIARQPSMSGSDLARAHLLLGVALQAQRLHPQALEALEEARRSFAQDYGSGHVLALLAGVHAAASRHVLGESAQALALIDAALPALRESLGDAAPLLHRIESMRADMAAPSHVAVTRLPMVLSLV